MKIVKPREPAWFNSRLRSYMRYLRRGLGVSLDELAKESGYGRAALDAMEKGYRAPDFVELANWAQALGYKVCIMPVTEGKLDKERRKELRAEVAQQ